MPKLNYKIVSRQPHERFPDLEVVSVEWRHADGPITDYHTVPISFNYITKEHQYRTEACGTRLVIIDSVGIRVGTPDSIVMQILEERRPRLAASLGIEP